MIPKSYGIPNEFFEEFEPLGARKLKSFLNEVDLKFRATISEIEETSDADPVFVGLFMSKELSSISKQIIRPDFSTIGISREDLDALIEHLAQEALNDYYRQF